MVFNQLLIVDWIDSGGETKVIGERRREETWKLPVLTSPTYRLTHTLCLTTSPFPQCVCKNYRFRVSHRPHTWLCIIDLQTPLRPKTVRRRNTMFVWWRTTLCRDGLGRMVLSSSLGDVTPVCKLDMIHRPSDVVETVRARVPLLVRMVRQYLSVSVITLNSTWRRSRGMTVTHTHTHTETLTDTHQNIDRDVYTYMTSYLTDCQSIIDNTGVNQL